MRHPLPLLLLAAVVAVALLPVPIARAQQVGTCSPALGEGYLDVNNVRARILNNGGLFYRGEPHVYNIPKGSPSNAIFTGGIWLGGMLGGQLRVAASRYGPHEFWAGPLDEAGNPPADCSVYDRIYKVSKRDVVTFEESGTAAPDLADWPTGLGAPTVDADGNVVDLLSQPLVTRRDRKINLAAGERPAFIGDQMLWWVMNDMGNTHAGSASSPIGVEVHGLAFAFDVSGHVANTTFYKYTIFHKGSTALTDAYMGVFSDPDMGDFGDDWVGSEPNRGVGYVWNADNYDGGASGYGTPPPAVGYDFFQGPIVPSPGDVARVSGREVPGFRNLGMTSFVYFNNGGGLIEDPNNAQDYYYYMQARWKDGKPITEGGNGRDFSETPTKFMFSGDAASCSFWTECNADGNGAKISPGDRRFVLSTGPFTINPGDRQEIVYGIVYGLGTDNFNSVTRMLEADDVAQAAWDSGFDLADPVDAPVVEAFGLDAEVALTWDYPIGTNNYGDGFRQPDPLGLPGSTYQFEGYRLFSFEGAQDTEGTLIGTFDKVNGVTRVIDGPVFGDCCSYVAASGTDNGVTHSYAHRGLSNYRRYYYGIQAYAYSSTSTPKVIYSPIARVSAVPMPRSGIPESTYSLWTQDGLIRWTSDSGNKGHGVVEARVANPLAVRNAKYEVRFFNHQPSVGPACLSYDVYRDGTIHFDGRLPGGCAPLGEHALMIDGLQLRITGPESGIAGFDWVRINGIEQSDACGSFQFNGSGFPATCSSDRPPADFPWGIHAGGAQIPYGPATDGFSFLARATRGAGVDSEIGAYDFEIRFISSPTNGNTPKAWRAFQDGTLMDVPLEIWNIGIGTPNDPSDDVRLIPYVNDVCSELVFDSCGDHPISGGANDPLTDWIYFYNPDTDRNGTDDLVPGQGGYESFMSGTGGAHGEVFARLVFVCYNCGTAPPYLYGPHPTEGSVLRITTLKPLAHGDVFAFNSGAYDWNNDGTPDALGSTARSGFYLPLTLSNESITTTVDIGLANGATSGYDIESDRIAPPPPPVGALDFRSVVGTDHLLADIRDEYSDVAEWTLSIQHTSQSSLLSWDRSLFPDVGDLRLRDGFGGMVFNINMKEFDSYSIPSSVTQVVVRYSSLTEVSTTTYVGWNLVGSPMETATDAYAIYPSAIPGSMYEFDGSYRSPSSPAMDIGTGYWIRLSEGSADFGIRGKAAYAATAALNAGWNLVSPPNCSIPASALTSAGVLPGTIYGWNGAYQPAEVIKAGSGYWARTAAASNLVLSCAQPAGKQSSSPDESWLAEFASISLRSASGSGGTVFVGAQIPRHVSPLAYSVPPPSPGRGSWLPSFSDGRYVSVDPTASVMLDPDLMPYTISVGRMANLHGLEVRDLAGSVLTSIPLVDAREVIVNDERARSLAFMSAPDLPTEFTLDPAYPNPFNPLARIRFGLPEAMRVRLEVYDAVGRRIALLVDQDRLTPGWHQVEFDGRSLASGVYFYRLSTGLGSQVRSMVLHK